VDLLQNPFHILTATPRDNHARIMDLADERSLLLDAEECVAARLALTTPRKRLVAEVAWLPGIGPKRAEEVLALLDSRPTDILTEDKLLPAAKANALAAALSRLQEYRPGDIAKWIIKLAEAFEEIEPEKLKNLINEERVVAGFPEVTDFSAIEEEIQERRRYYRQVIKAALDNLASMELVEAVTDAVESATDIGEEHCPILIADLVDAYEVDAQGFLDREEENILAIVGKLRTAVDAESDDSVLEPMVNRLIQVVKNWDLVAQPIQVSTKSRGLDHNASLRVAKTLRSLAIDMFNEHGKLELCQQLTNMLQEVFAEVVEIAELTANDADTLDDLAEQRARWIKDEKQRTEEWRKEIAFEMKVGSIFKDTFRISHEGIDWEGHRWPLDSITRLRWGGTRRSGSFGSTETTFKVFFGTTSRSGTIELQHEGLYSLFVQRLWKAVGVRLLTEYLEGLRAGNKYRFGSVVISDNGMELRSGFFSGGERVFCRWDELNRVRLSSHV
jgi:hypothetical protein